MNSSLPPHPSDRALSAYGLGKLEDAPAAEVHRHLEGCIDCRRRVAAMSSDSFLNAVRKGRVDRKTLPPGLADHPDYEITRELGRGGMGVVYLAHNTLMGRDEVLKVMNRHLIEKPGVLDRFLREIRAVAQLRHPNIVGAYAALRLGDDIVFAMEYVDGLDLARMVKSKGPLPVAHACNFIHQAALGLQHAHEKGLVHRDVKPGNLMLSRDGKRAVVKILDFGLARAGSEVKVDHSLTQEGQMLGTPDYMAPEQWVDAQKADIRADVYSLGCSLYYLLSAGPPFRGSSLFDMFQAHQSMDARPLNFLRPEVPMELAAVVAKMMAKEPEKRYQTPKAAAEALLPFFQKTSAAFKAPRADVSTSTRPSAAPAAAPSSQPPVDAPPERSHEGPRWESMIELRNKDSSIRPSPSPTSTLRAGDLAPPRRKWPLALAAGLVGLVALGGIIVTLRDRDGKTTTIATDGAHSFTVETGDHSVSIRKDEPAATEPGESPKAGAQAERPSATASHKAETRLEYDAPRVGRTYRLLNVKANKVLEAVIGVHHLQLREIADRKAQIWMPLPHSSGAMLLQNMEGNRYVNIDHQVADGKQVILYGGTGRNSQWKVEKKENGAYRILFFHAEFALAAGRSRQAPVVIQRPGQGDEGLWRFVPTDQEEGGFSDRGKSFDSGGSLEHPAASVERAPTDAETAARPIEPEAPIPGRPIKKSVDLAKLKPRPGELSLLAEGETPPPGPFWPVLTPEDQKAWRFGDPANVSMNAKGIVVAAGDRGNFVVTRKETYKKAFVRFEVEADDATEAYLVVRAKDGPAGWDVVGSRVVGGEGKVRVGLAGVGFADDEKGLAAPIEYAPRTRIPVNVQINEAGRCQVFVRGTPTASESFPPSPGDGGAAGAVGVFVKAGRLVIHSMQVQ